MKTIFSLILCFVLIFQLSSVFAQANKKNEPATKKQQESMVITLWLDDHSYQIKVILFKTSLLKTLEEAEQKAVAIAQETILVLFGQERANYEKAQEITASLTQQINAEFGELVKQELTRSAFEEKEKSYEATYIIKAHQLKNKVLIQGYLPQDKEKKAYPWALTIIPIQIEYYYLRFYSNSEVERESDPQKRSMESYYPIDFSYLFGVNAAVENLLGENSYLSGSIAFQYPKDFDAAEYYKSIFSMYRLNALFDDFGFDLQFVHAKGFVRATIYQDSAFPNVNKVIPEMESYAFSTNLYYRLFELNGQKCSLAENLEPLKMPPDGIFPLWDLFYLNASYDYMSIKSDRQFLTANTQTLFGIEPSSNLTSHLFNLSVNLAAKFKFFEHFFYFASIPVVSIFYSHMDFGNSRVEKNYGVESVFKSLSDYLGFASNSLEGYTKNLIMSSLGYNDGTYFVFAQFYYNIINLEASSYTLQQISMYLQLSIGMSF